jgi:hypothetical protein
MPAACKTTAFQLQQGVLFFYEPLVEVPVGSPSRQPTDRLLALFPPGTLRLSPTPVSVRAVVIFLRLRLQMLQHS